MIQTMVWVSDVLGVLCLQWVMCWKLKLDNNNGCYWTADPAVISPGPRM